MTGDIVLAQAALGRVRQAAVRSMNPAQIRLLCDQVAAELHITGLAVDAALPISLPGYRGMFADQSTTGPDGVKHHKCWFCSPSLDRRPGEPLIKSGYPPMPAGYTLCARCSELIYTGADDPENEAMTLCIACNHIVMDTVEDAKEPR